VAHSCSLPRALASAGSGLAATAPAFGCRIRSRSPSWRLVASKNLQEPCAQATHLQHGCITSSSDKAKLFLQC
jgi:hypothetical protein